MAMYADLTPTHPSFESKLQYRGPTRLLETPTMTHCWAQPDMAAIKSFISSGAGGGGRWVAEWRGDDDKNGHTA